MDTRRRFIRDCSTIAASAALLPAAVMAAPRRWREVSLADVAFGILAAQVNSRFLLRNAAGEAQSLELIQAESTAGNSGLAHDGGLEKFSLLFRGTAAQPLGQDTYFFEHARLGRFQMFIARIGCENRSHCYYEAVFHRPAPESRQLTRPEFHG